MLFGAVGGPQWDGLPFAQKPERGLLRLRKDLELFANLRPALCFDALKDASTPEAGDRFGPRYPDRARTDRRGLFRRAQGNHHSARRPEARRRYRRSIRPAKSQRIARVAFELARLRGNARRLGGKIQCDGDGRAVARSRHQGAQATNFPMSSSAMSWPTIAPCSWCAIPSNSTCIVTDNLFGDVLSDEAAQLTGSIGMLPSASLGAKGRTAGRRRSMSRSMAARPDIAGQGPGQSHRLHPLLRHVPALFLRPDRRRGAAGKGGGAGAGGRLSHRRHHAAGHDQGRHRGDDRCDPEGAGERCRPSRATTCAGDCGRRLPSARGSASPSSIPPAPSRPGPRRAYCAGARRESGFR